MQPSDYKVGLVLSHAGFNGNQLAAVTQRLKFILKTWASKEGAGVILTAPGFPHDGARVGTAAVERMLEPLLGLKPMQIVVVENAGSAEDCARLFDDHDEVWCVPASRQSKLTKARPWVVYDHGMSLPGQYRKYKMIPPWVEPVVAEARDATKKPKAMKG